jgi:hypothetical protein
MEYMTEAQIRTQVVESLKAKRRDAKGEVDIQRVQAELADPKYSRWIEARIEDAKRAKRLVTERQLVDLRRRRELQVGDKVRYIGPQRLETSPVTGRGILRLTGQTGTITRVQKTGSRSVFSFMPDIDKKTREVAEGMDVEVLELTTAEWIEFERLES